MTAKSSMLKHMHIKPSSGVGRPTTPTSKHWFFMKPKQSKAEALPDPNPVKTTKDQLGNVTKMKYQAMPPETILPSVEGDADE